MLNLKNRCKYPENLDASWQGLKVILLTGNLLWSRGQVDASVITKLKRKPGAHNTKYNQKPLNQIPHVKEFLISPS